MATETEPPFPWYVNLALDLTRRFRHLSITGQRIVTLLLLGGSVTCAVFAWAAANKSIATLRNILEQEIEPTDNSRQAIEALILHSSSESIIGADPSADTRQAIDAMRRSLLQPAASPASADLPLSWRPDPYRLLRNKDSKPGFVFAPGSVLQNQEAGSVTNLLRSNPTTTADLLSAFASRNLLIGFDGKSLNAGAIVQAFLIFPSGVLVIHHTLQGIPDSSYAEQFRGTQYFPARHYAAKAIDGSQRGPFWAYVSRPYIDLGGNGPVITYCCTDTMPGGRIVVLGLDCKLPFDNKGISKILGAAGSGIRFGLFNAYEVGDSVQWLPLEGKIESMPRWVVEKQKKAWSKSTRSDLTGMILTNNETSSDSHRDKSGATRSVFRSVWEFVTGHHDEHDVEFLVPLGTDAPQTLGRFALVRVDVDQVTSGVGKWGAASVLFGVCCVLCFGLMFYQYELRRMEQDALLGRIARLMERAQTPFAWIDELGRFKSVNRSFAALLGYESPEALVRNEVGLPRGFREVLTAESLPGWLQVQASRAEALRRGGDEDGLGLESSSANSPYELAFRMRTGDVTRALVQGDSVRTYQESAEGPVFLESFGIVLRVVTDT